MLMMGYVTQLYEPLKTMGKNSAALQSYLANIERAFALLDELPEVEEKANPRSLARGTGRIVFENVSFTYGQNRPALEQVSFEVKSGMCVGIVGTTGAGKTTLVNLLTRFYDPTEGQILLDGVDLRDHKLKDLRNQFAIVLQESVLFSTSLAENIAYARPSASEAEIVAAAKAANAHEFISKLPEGYQTLVGDRGMRLSGGERQRISVARAFLKDAPILILDEPTSSVDVRTETLILDAMERLAQGRTTLVITHRPSALKQCDVVVRIEKGRLAAIESTAGTQLVDSMAARRPFSILTTTSHCFKALGLWVITSVVRPWASRSIASRMSVSVLTSTELVGSSRINIGASFKNARATEMRWRSPPERRMPRSPTSV